MKFSNTISKIAAKDGQLPPEQWKLTGTKQINLFIGANNSGKSRFVRDLFKIEKENFLYDYSDFPILNVLQCALDKVESGSLNNPYINRVDVQETIQQVLSEAISNVVPIYAHDLSQSLLERSELSQNYIAVFDEYVFKTSLSNSNEYKQAVSHRHKNWSSVYIPTLRSLRHIDDNDKYLERTKKDYFPANLSSGQEIFTGHEIYSRLKKYLLGSHEERNKVREYESYLSTHFFFGQSVAIVPRIDTDVVYFKEGDKEERPIYDLGDGIQSVILLTFPVFMANKPTMFFIEEPEHYLHAGLQRTLIETFASQEQHMFFITTHSNHFLDLAQERNDISVQHVSREVDKTVVRPSSVYGEILTSLGVRASSVLLANCSIWVEGVTDKLYLRTYLAKYIDELDDVEEKNRLSSYHENLHYVFAEYQGSNITHWDFSQEATGNSSQTPARKLSSQIFLIADADIQTKGDRVQTLTTALQDNFHLLEWKEIENYIPSEIIISTSKKIWELFKGKQGCRIDRFSNINDEIFRSKSTGIGEILESYVDKPNGLDREFFKDKSGTVKEKVKFCRVALEIMNDKETQWVLSPELRLLCEKIWKFIEQNNHR